MIFRRNSKLCTFVWAQGSKPCYQFTVDYSPVLTKHTCLPVVSVINMPQDINSAIKMITQINCSRDLKNKYPDCYETLAIDLSVSFSFMGDILNSS